MSNRSRLGYSRNSPYKEDRVNQIGGSAIDMTDTDQPIVGTDGETATVMQPGSSHQFNGPVTETTLNNLEEMEADLLEAHLSTLSEEDQEEFVEKYEQLEDNMRLTALTQMFRKHKDKIKYQAGGFTYTPSTDFLPAGYVLTDVINKDPTELNTVMEGKPQSESKPAKTSQLQSTAKRQIKSKTMPAVVQPKTEPSNLPLELRMEKFLSPPPKTPSPEWFGAKRNTILDNLSDAELLDSYQAKVAANIKDPMLYQEMAKRKLLNTNAAIPVSTTTSMVDTLTNKLPYGWARNLPTQRDFDNILIPGAVVGKAQVKEKGQYMALLEDQTGQQFAYRGNKAIKLTPQNATFFPGPPNLSGYDLNKGADIPQEITSRFKSKGFSGAFEQLYDPVTWTELMRDKKSGKYFKYRKGK